MRKLVIAVLCLFSCLAVAQPQSKPQEAKPASDILVLQLDGVVDDSSVGPIVDKLKELKADLAKQKDSQSEEKKLPKEVYLEISSPGGGVWQGIELINAMKDVPLPKTCIATGPALSMGMVIFGVPRL